MDYMMHLVLFSLLFQPFAQAACDYESLNTDLNACIATASGATTTKWAFPVGGIADQATICESPNRENMITCIENIFTVCQDNAKSMKMFGKDGANIANAYTSLCSSSWFTEATACMSSNDVTADKNQYTVAESAFANSVDALNVAASETEICGLATTLVYTAYYDLLTEKCDNALHLQVWRDFYDAILETYVCSSCTSSASSFVHSQSWKIIVSVCLLLNSIMVLRI